MSKQPENRGTKVYLAGWDVFRPNAVLVGEELKAMCASLGLTGLYPLDNRVPEALAPAARAKWIFEANRRLIVEANVVVANLNPFRGYEPDSGTCWEVGFAHALGKPVYGYLWDTHRTMRDRVPGNGGVDIDGFAIEGFGLPVNLMLGCCVNEMIDGSALHALRRVAAVLLPRVVCGDERHDSHAVASIEP